MGISSITEYEDSNDSTFYSTVQRMYLFVVCAACIIYISIIKVFMYFYVGVDFRDAWRYVPLLLVSAVFSSISSFMVLYMGHSKKLLIICYQRCPQQLLTLQLTMY